jgi:hypothetical protein
MTALSSPDPVEQGAIVVGIDGRAGNSADVLRGSVDGVVRDLGETVAEASVEQPEPSIARASDAGSRA